MRVLGFGFRVSVQCVVTGKCLVLALGGLELKVLVIRFCRLPEDNNNDDNNIKV